MPFQTETFCAKLQTNISLESRSSFLMFVIYLICADNDVQNVLSDRKINIKTV